MVGPGRTAKLAVIDSVVQRAKEGEKPVLSEKPGWAMRGPGGPPARDRGPPPAAKVAGARAAGKRSASSPAPPASGDDYEPGDRRGGVRNKDKRTSRREHRDDFVEAIEAWRRREIPAGGAEELAANRSLRRQTILEGSVRACVRSRPIFERETGAKGDFEAVTVMGDGQAVALHDCRMKPDMKGMFMDTHRFHFDTALPPGATNDEVYWEVGMPELVDFAAAGGYGTVFMFGQTGSGKTYTTKAISDLVGVDLFGADAGASGTLSVVVTAFELLGSNLTDLLPLDTPDGKRPAVTVMEDKRGEMVISGLAEVECRTPDELAMALSVAQKARATAPTGVHDQSSRSHAVYSLRILDAENPRRVPGVLNLVDLAGSERGKDSASHDARLVKESAEINYSLMVLKDCMRARAKGQPHVPYRQSKLTSILKASLQGTAKTVVVATLSPCATDVEHSMNTLEHTSLLAASVVGREGHKGKGSKGAERTEVINQAQADAIAEREALVMPAKWDAEQAAAWWVATAAQLTKRFSLGNPAPAVPPGLTGPLICRFAVKRFEVACRDDAGCVKPKHAERLGQLMFEALQDEKERCRGVDAARRKSLLEANGNPAGSPVSRSVLQKRGGEPESRRPIVSRIAGLDNNPGKRMPSARRVPPGPPPPAQPRVSEAHAVLRQIKGGQAPFNKSPAQGKGPTPTAAANGLAWEI